MNKCATVLAATVALVACSAACAADWPQFGFDPAHSGVNSSERLLTAGNVHNMSLHYSLTLPSVAEGAPVYLSGVTTSSGVKNILYLTLNNGTLLALDASTGSTLWSAFASDTNDCVNFTVDKPCVTASSPALDPNRAYVYNYAIDGKVHRYRVADGVEITTGGWPEVVTAKPDVEQVSSALSVATAQNGHSYLYATISGASWLQDDSGDYQGHVTAIDLGSGAQITFNVVCATQGNVHFVESLPNPPVSATPDCLQQFVTGTSNTKPTGDGGIWGRAGVVYDSVSDRIYVSTGNGLFGDNGGSGGYVGTDNWGDSVLALPAAMTTALTAPLDSYTPTNFSSYMVNDTDLGSTSMVLVPPPAGSSVAHIGVQGGKDGNLRILNLDNLSGSGAPGATGGELDVRNVPQINEVKTQPLVWVNPSDGSVMLIAANNFGISATEIVAAPGTNIPMFTSSGAPNWMNIGSGAPSSTTEGGTSPVLANGVLYYAGGSGVQALKPLDGSLLWSDVSMGTANASTASAFHKQSVIVVDGQLFSADKHGTLWAYRGDEIFFDGFGEP